MRMCVYVYVCVRARVPICMCARVESGYFYICIPRHANVPVDFEEISIR